MYKLTTRIMSDFRLYRTRILAPMSKKCIKLGITANTMTTLSLVSGLLATYHLFSKPFLFIVFAILHLLADAFDGVIARQSTETTFGKYYDWFVDQLITVIIIAKIGLLLDNYYAHIAAALYTITQLIYFTTKGNAPILFTRTITLISVAIPFVYLYSLAYIITVIVSIYVLILQAHYFIIKTRRKPIIKT